MKKKFKKKNQIKMSLRRKMIFSILPAMIVIFTIVAVVIYFYNAKNLYEEGKKEIELLAKNCAKQIENEFFVFFEKEKAYNDIVSEFKSFDINSRRMLFVNLTRKFLENNETVLAYWCDFDKNTFDGQDDKYRNVNVFGSTGRMDPSFYRGIGGKILPEMVANSEERINDDYFRLPREVKATIIIEPYRYSYIDNTDNGILMTSIASPVFNQQNQVIGVTGIDLSLEHLVTLVNQIKIFGVGFATMISPKGFYLAHPDEDLLGKSLFNDPHFPKDINDSIYELKIKGEKFSVDFTSTVDNERYLVYFEPVTLGKTETNLMVSIFVPYKVLISRAEELLILDILSFSIIIILITTIIIIIAYRLSAPLKQLSRDALKLTEGDLSFELNIHSNDETGELAKAFMFVNQTIGLLLNEINRSIRETLNGNLQHRVDVNKFRGDYSKIINGVNNLVEAFIDPIEKLEQQKIILAEQKKELEELNEEKKLILDNTNDMICVLDLSASNFTFVAGACYNIFGYTPEEYIQMSVKDIMTSESYQFVLETIATEFGRYERGEIDYPEATFEVQQYRKDGSLIWVEISAKAILNKKNELVKIVAITRNIDDRKTAEFQISQQKEELEQQKIDLERQNGELEKLNAEKDKFFSIIAHDLRNPFTPLLSLSELLEDSYDDMDADEVKKIITIIHNSSESVYKLLENLLEWSRSARGEMAYEPVENNINEIIYDCVNHLQSQTNAKNISIELPDNLIKIDVMCDMNMIHTVIRNLVSNAIKFSFDSSTIKVSVNDYSEDSNYVQVSVRDSGVGISQENIDKLFKIDQKITSTEGTNKETGTGLGLILCKEFIDKHNCKIWAESEIGKGTTFSFTLPKIYRL